VEVHGGVHPDLGSFGRRGKALGKLATQKIGKSSGFGKGITIRHTTKKKNKHKKKKKAKTQPQAVKKSDTTKKNTTGAITQTQKPTKQKQKGQKTPKTKKKKNIEEGGAWLREKPGSELTGGRPEEPKRGMLVSRNETGEGNE